MECNVFYGLDCYYFNPVYCIVIKSCNESLALNDDASNCECDKTLSKYASIGSSWL